MCKPILGRKEYENIIAWCSVRTCLNMALINKKVNSFFDTMETIPDVLSRLNEAHKIQEVEKVFQLFPNAKEVTIPLKSLTHLNEDNTFQIICLPLFKKLTKIHVTNVNGLFEQLEPLRHNLVSIETLICYYDDFQVHDYESIQSLTLDFNRNPFDFGPIFNYREEPLEELTIRWFTDYKLLYEIMNGKGYTKKLFIEDEITSEDEYEYMERITKIVDCHFSIRTTSDREEDVYVAEEGVSYEIVDAICDTYESVESPPNTFLREESCE